MLKAAGREVAHPMTDASPSWTPDALAAAAHESADRLAWYAEAGFSGCVLKGH